MAVLTRNWTACTLWYFDIAIENHHVLSVNQLQMDIFHTYATNSRGYLTRNCKDLSVLPHWHDAEENDPKEKAAYFRRMMLMM